MKFLCALLVICAIDAALSQRVGNGQCPTVTAQSIANSDFLGLWFGAFKVNFAPTAGTKCNYACYALEGTTLSVTNHFVNTTTGASETIAPYVGSFTGNGEFTVSINGAETHFKVLALNDKAASLYSCDNISATQYRENVFGLSRDPQASAEAIAFAREGFTSQNISLDDTIANDQTNCQAASC